MPTDTIWHIRRAAPADADAACQVLRDSITQLCTADHGNAPEPLAAWLANKTSDNLTLWIADPGAIMLVADTGSALIAVGAIRLSGEITLNYIAPRALFRGQLGHDDPT